MPRSRNHKRRILLRKSIATIALGLALLGRTIPTRAGDEELRGHKIKHVLLISVDGLHLVDAENWIKSHPKSTLASLARGGVTFTNAKAPTPSDSFPGLLALVTGGTPRTTGVYYDDSYDRTLFSPGSDCKGNPGTEIVYDESIDHDVTKLFQRRNRRCQPAAGADQSG